MTILTVDLSVETPAIVHVAGLETSGQRWDAGQSRGRARDIRTRHWATGTAVIMATIVSIALGWALFSAWRP